MLNGFNNIDFHQVGESSLIEGDAVPEGSLAGPNEDGHIVGTGPSAVEPSNGATEPEPTATTVA